MLFAARTVAATVLMVVALVLAPVRPVWAADPVEVFLDGRDPAFLVVQGVAADTADLARREMAGYATLDGVSLVAWDSFRQNAQALMGPHVVKDEYPGSSTILSLIALVKAYPGRPFALTWNGGLAVSFQDYQYAVSTLQAYGENSEAYESSRLGDLEADPLNPENHLAVLLGR